MKQIGATLEYCTATINYGLSHPFFLHRDLGKARESWQLIVAQAGAIRKFLEEAEASRAVLYIKEKIALVSRLHRQEYNRNKKEFMARLEATMS